MTFIGTDITYANSILMLRNCFEGGNQFFDLPLEISGTLTRQLLIDAGFTVQDIDAKAIRVWYDKKAMLSEAMRCGYSYDGFGVKYDLYHKDDDEDDNAAH